MFLRENVLHSKNYLCRKYKNCYNTKCPKTILVTYEEVKAMQIRVTKDLLPVNNYRHSGSVVERPLCDREVAVRSPAGSYQRL